MKILPMADGRWPINESFEGRCLAGGCHNRCQSVGLFQQRRQFFSRHDARLNQQLEPQVSFVRFLFDSTNFGDEFRPASLATRCAIIGRDGSPTVGNLPGNSAAGIVVPWNRAGQSHNPQRKCFGTTLKLNRVHIAKVQIQSAIGHRQPAITR